MEEFQKESLKICSLAARYLTEKSLGSEPLFSIVREKGFRSKTLRNALATAVLRTQLQGGCVRAGLGGQLGGRSSVLPPLISRVCPAGLRALRSLPGSAQGLHGLWWGRSASPGPHRCPWVPRWLLRRGCRSAVSCFTFLRSIQRFPWTAARLCARCRWGTASWDDEVWAGPPGWGWSCSVGQLLLLCSWSVAALRKTGDSREPSVFYCYNINEKKKGSLFYDHSNLHYIFL